jgi:hypothetical protein
VLVGGGCYGSVVVESGCWGLTPTLTALYLGNQNAPKNFIRGYMGLYS